MKSAIDLIEEDDLEDLAVGCTVLAGGGGGDPRVGLLMAQHAIRNNGPVRLIQLSDLSADDLVVPVGMIGAPTVMIEKIPNGNESKVICKVLEKRLGKPVAALMPLEMGGLNGMLPVAWASLNRLPMVDGDLMGRAFPELQMCTPHLYGIPSWPGVLVDERMQSILIESSDDFWFEKLARTAVTALGGCGCAGFYPMTAEVAALPLIPNTVSLAIQIGAAIRNAEGDPFSALDQVIATYPLIRGKVIDVERRTTGGFVRGAATIEGLESDRGRVVRIEFQNENLIVLEDGKPLASVPDIITLLDLHTAKGIVTEHIRFGQRVVLAAFRSPEQWRSAEGLKVVGPRAFGHEIEYSPIEENYARIA